MKIKGSVLWFIFLPFVFYFHLFKILVFLFLLMSIHEGMHVLCALRLGYQVDRIVVYPFGICATIIDFEYKYSWDEIWITLSGLSVHLIAAFFIPLFKYFGISSFFIMYMQRMNLSLLCFNLLPIYPLDGGRLIRNILELFLPFKMSKYLSYIISLSVFCMCMIFLPFLNVQKYLFLVLFFVQYIFLLLYNQEDIRSFFLYRLLHSSFKEVKIHHLNDVYKNKMNVYIRKGTLQTEKDVLREWI